MEKPEAVMPIQTFFCFFCVWEDLAHLTLPLRLVCAVGAKANVPNVREQRNFQKHKILDKLFFVCIK